MQEVNFSTKDGYVYELHQKFPLVSGLGGQVSREVREVRPEVIIFEVNYPKSRTFFREEGHEGFPNDIYLMEEEYMGDGEGISAIPPFCR